MAIRESFKNLIEGLAGAVVEAQRRIETHQLNNVLRFFDKDRRPKTIDLRLPSPDPRPGDKEDVIYRVPFLPLVAGNQLRIKEVEIEFDAELTGIHDGTDEKPPAPPPGKDKAKHGGRDGLFRNVQVDIRGGGILKRRTGTIQVKLKVEGRDMSESMARLVDRLIQTQGDIAPK